MVKPMPGAPVLSPPDAASVLPGPADLPAVGSQTRWTVLQRLRRSPDLDPQPWIEALASGLLPLESDLLVVLAERCDAPQAVALLECWLQRLPREPHLPALIGQRRDPVWAARLRRALSEEDVEVRAVLLPLLGHQRDPADFPRLRALLVQPGPLPVRHAALEALQRGLSAWPVQALRRTLSEVARDLHPVLAGGAVDALARLPAARADLLRLARHRLAPEVGERLQRRLRRLPAAPLLLLVHGRSGGCIPAELQALAAELEHRRGSPVRLQALTDPAPPRLPQGSPLAPPTTLVPLLLLPGSHVRHDLPGLAAALGLQGPLRRLPFLGAWPSWQRALAAEVATLAGEAEAGGAPVQLLHHPLQGPLAERYLTLLARRCGAVCRPASFDTSGAAATLLAATPASLPLALAANRLTDSLQAADPGGQALPLLARPRLWHTLLEALQALP